MTDKRKLVRFSLASLLGIIILAALLFGYAKWRHNYLQHEYGQLWIGGVTFEMQSQAFDLLEFIAIGEKRTATPYDAVIWISYLGDDKYLIGEKELTLNELQSELVSIKERIKMLSIPHLRYSTLKSKREPARPRRSQRPPANIAAFAHSLTI